MVETELAPLGEGRSSPGFPGDGWLLSDERVAVTGCRVGRANRACPPPLRMLRGRAEGLTVESVWDELSLASAYPRQERE